MPLGNSEDLQISQHTLRISNPEVSLPFYQAKFGMTLLTQRVDGAATHFYFGYVDSGTRDGGRRAEFGAVAGTLLP